MVGLEVMKWSTNSFETSNLYDSEVESWPMMSSPTPVFLIIVFYLYFILSLGPKLMAKRKPFDLKQVMIAYNLYQVIFSTWLCWHLFGSPTALKYVYQYACWPLGREDNPYIHIMNASSWWYFISKIIELLDTVFFVLRKKQNQITVLHVYHHTTMVFSTWGYLKFVRGEQAIIPGFLNCFVHVIMYSYYLLAALGPGVQKYLWWKKYLTKLQLTQFILILLYLTTMIVLDCDVPRGLTLYMTVNTIIFLALFINFYNKSYTRVAKDKTMTNGDLTPTLTKNKEDINKNL